MQYNHRSRLPPPPFGRGGYPRGHKQPYYAPSPPPPFPPAPPPPPLEGKYEVLMEAGRLAAEYLVAQGVLPPAALLRGAGVPGPWPGHPLPPPPQLLPQEPPGFYGRRRYEDEYNNNPSGLPRRPNGTTSSTSSRDDCSSGSYNGRGKRKYGEYRRGHFDSGREKERGRPFPNGRRYEDGDEDGAPGFRRERRRNRWGDEARTNVTEAVREETPLTAKAVAGLCMEDATSKIMSCVEDTSKDANDASKVLETEEGELEDDSETQNSETEVVKQGIDTDVNQASCLVVTESDANQLPDVKIQDEIPGKEAEDDKNVMDEATLDHNSSDGEVTNMEVEMHVGKKSLIDYCNFTRTPTRPRSVRAHRYAVSIPGETAVVETVDQVSSGQASKMVISEPAERSLTNITTQNGEDKICQENTSSGDVYALPKESMLLQGNGIPVVSENMAEEKVDAQPHVVAQQYKEETNLSLLTDALEKSLMPEATLSPLAASHKESLTQEDGLMKEADLSTLTANHRDSLIEETKFPPSTASHKDSLIEETDLTQTVSSYENNLKLQFKEGTQICDIDMLPQDGDPIELPNQRKIIGCDVGAEAVIEMEDGKLDQSSSLNLSDIDLVGGTEVAAIHNNSVSVQPSAGSSAEANNKQKEDIETFTGANASPTDDLCQLPLDNMDVQVIHIECGKPVEDGGFDLSKPTHNNPVLVQPSAAGSSAESNNKQQEDLETFTVANASPTDDLCQLPLYNKDVQVIDIECGTPVDVGGFDLSKSKNEMVCSSIDSIMDPGNGIHTDVLPGIQDSYSLAFSDFLGSDIPCYPSMQSDLHARIGPNNSEGITVMDDPIYGSLTDIGFMDVWGQPTEDYDKFF